MCSTLSLLLLMSFLQILSQASQNQSQQHVPASSATSSLSSQIQPPPTLPPPSGLSPAQFVLHGSLPLVGCTKTPPSLLNSSISGGCTQTPPSILPGMLSGMTGSSGDTGWDNEGKDPEKVMFIFMKISGWLALFYKYTVGRFLFLQIEYLICRHSDGSWLFVYCSKIIIHWLNIFIRKTSLV